MLGFSFPQHLDFDCAPLVLLGMVIADDPSPYRLGY